MPHVSLLPFFYTDGLRYSSLIYQTQKVSRVSSIRRSVWVPGALRFQKPQCKAFNGKFVSFPLTLLQSCMGSAIACKEAKVGQQGEGAASKGLSPRLWEAFSPHASALRPDKEQTHIPPWLPSACLQNCYGWPQ